MLDEPGDVVRGRAARKPVEIVEDQRHFALLAQVVHELGQDDIDDAGCADDLRRRREPDTGTDPSEGLEHMRPEHDRVVVVLVDRQPCHRFPACLGRAPAAQQRRLAVARGSRDDDEPQARLGPQAVEETITCDELVPFGRRMKLGFQKARWTRHVLRTNRLLHRGAPRLRTDRLTSVRRLTEIAFTRAIASRRSRVPKTSLEMKVSRCWFSTSYVGVREALLHGSPR